MRPASILTNGAQVLWPNHCVRGSAGAEFHSALETVRASLVLRKGIHRDIDSYSAFYENDHKTPTGLAGYLRERGWKTLFLAGLAFDFCVRYSAEDARRAGFEAVVIEEACRGIDIAGSMAATHHSLKAPGIPIVGIEAFLTARTGFRCRHGRSHYLTVRNLRYVAPERAWLLICIKASYPIAL